MDPVLLALALTLTTSPSEIRPPVRCPEMARATATAYRLSEVPAEIQADLIAWSNNSIADQGVSLANEQTHTVGHFVQAARFHNYWLVQFEVTGFGGVTTVSYISTERAPYQRSSMFYFQGPACASIRAALDGVSSKGIFYPMPTP